MVLAIVIILLVIGTVIFHFASPWWFTQIASNWGTVDTTVHITFWVTGIVFVAVNLFLAFCIFRYRARKGQRAHFEPESKKLELWLTIVTAVGVSAMLAPGLWVWAKFVEVPADADIVEVVGQQWAWTFRYPGRDGQLGKTDIGKMTVDNPFGMDPEDPAGQDDVLIARPELHLPLGRPVKLLLRSKDVLHDFAVAPFRVKMDLVPGMITYAWLTPTRKGTFDVLCEEYCGIAHFAMRARVTVEDPDTFHAWLSDQPTFAEQSAAPRGDPQAGQALFAVCSACHGAQGEGNPATNAPKLAGQEGWYVKKQLHNFQQGLRGASEEDVFGKQMAPMASTVADETAMDNLVAYLATLPDKPAPMSVSGDPARGAELYVTCANCHGEKGQGIWSLNTPRLAGMSDWYLARQLENFKSGARGSNPADIHGAQMAFMARTLADQQAIDDLVAYIDTLD